MKIDFTKPLKEEQWIKDGMNESLASILKKYVYVGHGIDQNTDEKKHADTFQSTHMREVRQYYP